MTQRSVVVFALMMVLCAGGVVSVCADAAEAAKTPASPWTQEHGYGNQAMAKLGYGLQNTLLGWTELFTQPGRTIERGSNFFVGACQGVWHGIADTVGGVVHVVTFPFTTIDVPLPDGGTQFK